ncbi:flagellar hook protein FlgE [Aurantimonas endophytica]|uniref:Flagellar hook protein FlgE n=1 Tax=Aurantimonas endophytica TaxID=1522175 RepID=A0A7W6MP07_9HYPH|nr:flagellar hook protein FlgE [Aurantimonas endophytica]MBB4002490.1 flagellar hook protein FlgE [Aurantimonas endophytica]MCO6401889.1 flagellar hook-basal body complex protein [Aurantimonas endophytica]
MSINGVFRTSVSGMNAQANRLSVVSDNIANSSTTGYKRNSTEFSSLVIAQGGGEYNSGSVTTQVRQSVSQQGNIAASSSGSDLAIQGEGFFVVQDAAGREFYTRAGSFVQRTENNVTYLVNSAGYRLKDTTALDGSVGPITLPVGEIVAPQRTTEANFSLQFPESAELNATKKSSMVIYDNIGRSVIVDVNMEKTAANQWTISYTDDLGPQTSVINFDEATGLGTAVPAAMTYTTMPGNQTIAIGLGPLTEYATDFSTRLVANGNPAGTFAEFAFGEDGTLNGIMDTGAIIQLYQLKFARFPSPDQLSASAGNVYSATDGSGVVDIGTPGMNGFGSLVPSGLEQSNVDLASELTSMIESQRSYSANSKVFQTGSEILDVLVNLKR